MRNDETIMKQQMDNIFDISQTVQAVPLSREICDAMITEIMYYNSDVLEYFFNKEEFI